MIYRSLPKLICFLSFYILFLISCGGGGGGGGGGNNSSSSSTANQLSPQQVTFLFSEVHMVVGDTFGNIASAQGTGLITYSSSNSDIATVDSTGHVTAKQAGTVTITAIIAADNQYNSASGDYVLHIKTLEARQITFEKSGAFTLKINASMENKASTIGDGNISYESSNVDVATVDPFGFVFAHKEGKATIKASVERNQQYYEAQSSYEITVLPPKDIILTAWIGKENTLLNIPATTESHTLRRTASLACYISYDPSCADSQLDINSESTASDLLTSLTNHGYYFLGDAPKYRPLALSSEQIPVRYNHQMLSHKNQLFVFGGKDGYTNEPLNDIWISQTGKSWRQLIPDDVYQTLTSRMMISFNDKLWAIGGRDDNHNDIWSSTDGINWHQESTNAEFSSRHLHQLIVFNNKLMLIGGYTESNEYLQDVWSSDDGIHWTKVTDNANLNINSGIKLIAFEEKLWLFKEPNINTEGQLWSSSDGKSWSQVTISNGEALDRIWYEIVIFNNRIWIMGGAATDSDHIWSSIDGINWVEENDGLIFKDKSSSQIKIVAYNNQLIATGIYNDFSGSSSALTSANGTTWTEIPSFTDFPARHHAQVTYFKDQLWLVGGDDKNDVWTSKDGIIWTEQKIVNPFRDKFSSASLIQFNNKLWLIGGDNYDEQNDIWSSENGLSWTKEAENAEFPIQSDTQIVTHNNKLLIISNHFEENNLINELWVSTNGINWTQQAITSPFPEKHSFKVVSFNNKLWVIGGFTRDQSNNENTLSTDIWSSADGSNWTKEITNVPFDPRYDHSLIIFNNKLWIFGGQDDQYNNNFKNDVWSSTDGINWINQPTPPFSPRSGPSVTVYDDKLFLIGGSVYATPDSTYSSIQNDVWASPDGTEWRLGIYDLFRSNE